MKTHPIQVKLDALDQAQGELARFMGLDPSTLSNKLTGRRRWTQDEINLALSFFRQFEPELPYEALFAEAVA
ncbi:MAG: hypothetical protein ABI639_14445 [Thermoanaerobaculia bacterium]